MIAIKSANDTAEQVCYELFPRYVGSFQFQLAGHYVSHVMCPLRIFRVACRAGADVSMEKRKHDHADFVEIVFIQLGVCTIFSPTFAFHWIVLLTLIYKQTKTEITMQFTFVLTSSSSVAPGSTPTLALTEVERFANL